MRLFVSLELSEGTLKRIKEWRNPLISRYPDLRWTGDNQLHVTLRFLGERNPGQVISEMKNLNIERFLPVEYTLNRTGIFGTPPSVLWLSGIFSSEVFSLARQLGSIPDHEGKKGGSRRFTPHITVARIRRGVRCPDIRFDRQLRGTGRVIRLAASRLTPEGPVYTTLSSIRQ